MRRLTRFGRLRRLRRLLGLRLGARHVRKPVASALPHCTRVNCEQRSRSGSAQSESPGGSLAAHLLLLLLLLLLLCRRWLRHRIVV